MPVTYIMQLSTTGLSAIIGVNRAQNTIEPTGRGVSVILPVNDWIMPDNNKLSILLSQPEDEAAAATPPTVDIHLFIADPASRHNDPLTTLLRFTWPLPAPAPSPLPFLADLPFKITEPPPTLLWKEAAKIDQLTPADRADIVALVEQFRDALVRRDFDTAFRLAEYKYRDSSRADGSDYATQSAQIRDLYRDLLSDPALKPEPFSIHNAAFSIVGADKVVLVTRGLGIDAVRMVAGEPGKRRAYGFKIYVARIQNKWTIVR